MFIFSLNRITTESHLFTITLFRIMERSWTERLNKLNLPSEKCNAVDAVYFGGSKYINKGRILSDIAAEYGWASVSKVSFQTLSKQYHNNVDKVINHLLNNRANKMIYKHTNECIQLHSVIERYYFQYKHANKAVLQQLYDECCNMLQESSSAKMVIVINVCKSYFEQHLTDIDRLYMQSVAYLALLNKKNLYPFLEVILVMDDIDPVLQSYGVYNLIDTLKTPHERIIRQIDENLIKKIITDSHKYTNDIDVELC